MLQLTTGAANHLRSATERRDTTGGRTPRFARESGQIKLGFAPTPAPGETVMEISGIRLFVAEDIADKLEAAIIDVRREQDGKQVLVLRRQEDAKGQEDTKAAHV